MNQPLILPKEKRTVFTKTGVGDLGHVTDEIASQIGKPAGPIRLLNGVQGAKGGFGLAHIESHASRTKQIEGLGYNEIVAYIFFVACDYDLISAQDDGRLVFVREGGTLFHHVICQWDPEAAIWSVTTAIPKNNVRKLAIVWRKAA